jgi:hypothetical protein
MAFRSFRRSIPQPVERAMLRARRFIGIGQFGKAAALLAELAGQMDIAARPKAAAELHARAAHCYVGAGIASAALAESEMALNGFNQAGLPERAAHFQRTITQRMQAHGMQAGAEALLARFGTPPALVPAALPNQHLFLPTACPQCGAPLHRDEIEWIDERSGECAYCGAVIETR